ncbi:unnamed protein product [Rhizoctonia solani]|uniref:Uncharacterized protein n=1 Tax=Rhizoctonia solani TaxID=456999 RepID=A0A8H3DXC0_9AGAM|nr:unnamed protein product [Rhizoctonia solani]
MSAVVPPIATGSHHFTTAADKEALVRFWRSGIEYLAQGITAHHNITRETRISELYSRRAPPDSAPIPSLDARIAPHKETLESCVLALAELAASSLVQSSLSHQTQQAPSLEARVATLEKRTKEPEVATQPLDAKLNALTSNITRADSRIKSFEDKADATAAQVEKSHKALESRIVELSAQVANPPPTQAKDELEKLNERLTRAEARVTDAEASRTRVDAHGIKLALLEGRVTALQKEAGETKVKVGSVVALAPESKALLLVPGQIKQTGEDIQTLKEFQEAAGTRFDSFGAALEAVERRLNEQSTTPDSVTIDSSDLDNLKQQVNSLGKLPATLDRLQASVAELAPLKLHSQPLTAIAAQAPKLLELISHNERVQDDITQIRSKLARYNKDMADAKKHQTIQGDVSRTASQVAQLVLDLKKIEKESQGVSGEISGIDARFKATQLTVAWLQEQSQSMRADLTYLEPLKAQREALLLLSSRTEELMPLSIQLGPHEFQKILKKGERADATMDAARKLTNDLVTVCKDLQQRLGQIEPHVAQLESDVSSALEKLSDLQGNSSATEGHAQNTKQSLQKIQNDITPLLMFKPDILSLVGKLAPHRDALALLVGQVPALANDLQALQKVHASDITPMKGEVRKIKSLNAGVTALQKDVDDAKGKIAPLQQQLQAYQDNFNRLEQKIAKLEPGAPSSNGSSPNGPLTIRIPPANRTGGFSLSQSLNAGPSNSGSPRFRASTSSSARGPSTGSQPEPQPQPPTTPPAAARIQPRPPGGLIKLTEAADELILLVEKFKQTEIQIADLSESLNGSNKRLGELGDSVHGIDQLMTTVQKQSDDNQVTLRLLERDFQILKENNAAKVKEIDLKQARIPVMESELQSLKLSVNTKLTVMETDIHELAPLKEYTETLVAFAEPVLSPVSPAPHGGATQPISRLVGLERSAKSATKELINLNTWTQRVHADIKKCMSLGNEMQALDGRVQALAASVEHTSPLAASLNERASDLLDLLERPNYPKASDQSIQLTPKQLEGVARAVTRLQTIEEQIHALRVSQPKLEQELGHVTFQVAELVPTINKVKPFTDHVKSILSLVPLSNHVPSLVPLIDQVPQLHASIQSLSDRVDAAAAAAPSPADPGPASQLRSPVTDRAPSPVEPAEPSNENTALFVPATSEPRPNKRRRTEEVLQSFENQLDGLQGELDGVADEVQALCAERAKKMRTGDTPGETGGLRKNIEEDVDTVMDTLRSLFEGEGPWPEQIDLALGKRWARVLQPPQSQPDAGASSTIARLCEELEVLKTIIEAHGSGVPAPPSAIDAVHVAWADSLTEKVMANVSQEQAQFKTELEELIGRALQPMKKVFKVFRETPDI